MYCEYWTFSWVLLELRIWTQRRSKKIVSQRYWEIYNTIIISKNLLHSCYLRGNTQQVYVSLLMRPRGRTRHNLLGLGPPSMWATPHSIRCLWFPPAVIPGRLIGSSCCPTRYRVQTWEQAPPPHLHEPTDSQTAASLLPPFDLSSPFQ